MIQENNQMKETIQGLERERDFYFSKLRDIELLLQQAVEVDPELEKDEEGLVKHIQTILYSTEVSFPLFCNPWRRVSNELPFRRASKSRQKRKRAFKTTKRHSERVCVAAKRFLPVR